ncbi:nuclear transport factor 2 family protein [Streptomyces iconiensis]|uniref:Nuclear transport factor 2 family protein n=1 Tax=Streptomyces iconiensis TaxID=1384038 RepID=A0ABT7A8D3_9ACTN|nr:nuclear transport factor 2 family protein [Streptomyces iconiensis]MDJ1136888.1 nuclear transport factor 2 family protein [Streptomyces iconiensis]
MPSPSADPDAFPTLYSGIQDFYARQMRCLDNGAAEEWSLTFTEDARMALPGLPQPLRGRDALASAVRRAARDLAERGEVHRHWHGMLSVDRLPDPAAVRASCYALVIATPRNSEPRLHRSCVCEDTLVRADGRWLVRERAVTRDDLP